MKKIKYIILGFILTVPLLSTAQDEAPSKGLTEQYQVEIVLGLAVVVCLVALMTMLVLLITMKTILRLKLADKGVVEEENELTPSSEGEEGLGFWGRFWNRFHQAVPVGKEETIVTNHEYDGIRELDNRLPSWWLYGFYFSIIFGVAYLTYYNVGPGQSQEEEYKTEMAEAKEQVKVYLASLENLVDENSVEVSTEAADLIAGKAIYDANCVVCHANDGGGGVGPNLTDKYWIQGGDIKSIFRAIKYGVPEKGMISWQSQLPPKKIQQVSSYIYSLEGRASAKPKEPQGELFERANAPLDAIPIDRSGR